GGERRDALVISEQFSLTRNAVDRAPNEKQRIDRSDGGVVVNCEADATSQRGGERADAAGAVGAEKNITVTVTPVKHVPHEERGRDPKLFDAVELVFARCLTMFNPVPGAVAWKFLLNFRECGQYVVDRRVAIGMDRNL